MSIEGKLSYRHTYLRSEEWQTVRSEALAKADAHCAICGLRDIHNDAHHVYYEDSFWNTKPENLVILCRECHTLIHQIVPSCGKNGEKAFLRFRETCKAVKQWFSSIRIREQKQEKLRGKCLCCRKESEGMEGRWIPGKENMAGTFGFWCDECWNELVLVDIRKMSQFKEFLNNRRMKLGLPLKMKRSVDRS